MSIFDWRLLSHATDSKPDELVVVGRRVDTGTTRVQVVGEVTIGRRTRPIATVAALTVGTAAAPDARQD